MTFRHKFQSGDDITLTFDLSTNPPGLKSSRKVPAGCGAEFERWVAEVVEPAVMAELSKEQMDAMVIKGATMAGLPEDAVREILEWGRHHKDLGREF